MDQYKVKVLKIEQVTHSVKRFTIEKPEGYSFIPGQATDVSINKPGWEDRKRPFTFTCLNENPYLEFTIKIYIEHHKVTEQLGLLVPGDELIIRDVWGAINYKGPGVFIAGGAGVTPFIAIFRQLYHDGTINGNRLICSNKMHEDIILEEEFRMMLGDRFMNTLTREDRQGYENKRIDQHFVNKYIDDFSQHFYICGPVPFIDSVKKAMIQLGAKPDVVVIED